MFRKVNDFLNCSKGSNGSNGNGNASSSFQRKVEQLQGMGFDKIQAQNALEATGGNIEEATHHLLTNQSVLNSNLDLNLDSEQQQQQQTSTSASASASASSAAAAAAVRSAASIRAGQAAANRASAAPTNKFSRRPTGTTRKGTTKSKGSAKSSNTNNKNTHFEPTHNIKIPKKLSSKTKEEQILRCTQRLAPYPLAVDTLLQAFTHIKSDPNNLKYRKIDTMSAGYKRVLEGVPGALDLIHAMNFVERGGSYVSVGRDGGGYSPKDLILTSERVDHALLYLGTSALEEVRNTSKEYKDEKRRIAFDRDIKKILQGSHVNGEHEESLELVKRAEYLSKVPSEPQNGAGALMQVTFGKQNEGQGQGQDTNILSRKFDGDDILQDVLHWLGAHGSTIPQKILSRDWSLVDLNRYPLVPIDVEGNMDRTLQYIGCWPSGRLEMRASEEGWKEGKVTGEDMGSSRGLGSAPSSIVN